MTHPSDSDSVTHLALTHQLILQSTAAVAEGYFLLPIDGADSVYRERTYCYELYHQMKTMWPRELPYKLGGEVDKGGHPHFRETQLRNAKPDLLIHIPGTMQGNLLVIEVKSIGVAKSQLRDDFIKLDRFRAVAGYRRGALLVYGSLSGVLNSQMLRNCLDVVRQDRLDTGGIDLYWHESAGSEAHLIVWNDVEAIAGTEAAR